MLRLYVDFETLETELHFVEPIKAIFMSNVGVNRKHNVIVQPGHC